MTERWADDKLIEELFRRDDMVSWQAAKRLEELLDQLKGWQQAKKLEELLEELKEITDADSSDSRPSE